MTWTQIGSVPAGTATYAVAGSFSRLTTYDFRVRAYTYSYVTYTALYSPYATTSATTPAYPYAPAINWAAPQSSTSVALSWTDAPSEAGFRVERSANNGSTWAAAGTVAAGVTTFTDTGLSEATSYTYRVFATNGSGDSIPSATQAAVTPPGAPTGLSVVVVSGGQVNLTWTDHSSAATSYTVEQSPNGSTGWVQVGTVSGSTATSYAATGPFAGATTYYFRVHASAYPRGNSGYATASAVTPAFAGQPILTSAVAQSDTAVALAWTDVAGEAGFRVERSTNNNGTWTAAGTVGAGVTSFTDTGLTEAASYTYRVVATNGVGDSAPSGTRSVATQPSAPTGLTATVVSPSQVNLSWTDHSASTYYYYVEQSSDGTTWTQIGSVYGTASNTYTATGQFNGATAYYFRVRASSYGGLYSAYAPAASVTTPAFPGQPTLTSATAQSDTAVILAWGDVAGEAGFRVERSAGNNGTWTAAGTVGAGVTSFTDTGLTETTTCTYRVVATNAAGDSAPSPTRNAATQPTAPTGLAAVAVSPTQVNLSWTNRSAAATNYCIEQSVDGVTWQQVGSVYGTVASYTATGPFNGSTTYYFRVRGYAYTVGYSAYTAAASAATAAFPSLPTLSSATPQSDTAIALSWTDAAGEQGFRVERQVGGTWTAVGTVGAGVTTFTDAGLAEATTYTYRVVATNAAGDSAPSGSRTVAILLNAPQGVTVTFVSGSQMNVQWTDRSAAESGYAVEQSADGQTGWKQVGSLAANATSFTAPGPFDPATTYYFRVRVYNGSGYNSYSSSVVVTMPSLPLAPTGVTAVPTSDTAITITWTDAAGEDGYVIECSPNGSSGWAQVGTAAANQTNFSATGLTEGASRYYRVRSTMTAFAAVSSASRLSQATTLPARPTGLMATAVNGGQVRLQWQDNSGIEAGYTIEEWINGAYQDVLNVGPGLTDATIAGTFGPSTTYRFRVVAFATAPFSGVQRSLASDEAQLTTGTWPAVPSNLTAAAVSDSEIDLTWSDNASDETGYDVERSVDGTTWTQIAQTPAGAGGSVVFADRGLTGGEGATYLYRVRAFKSGAGESAYSDFAEDTTLPATPTNLSATIVDGGRVDLSWVDRSTIETAYIVQEWVDGDWQAVAQTGAGAQAMTVAGIYEPGTLYTIRVMAYTATDLLEAYSSPSSPATVTAPAWPATPTGLTTTAVSNTRIDLTWTDNASTETSYEVDRSTDGMTWVVLSSALPAGTQAYSDTGLADGTEYAYRVRALNGMGGSGYALNAAATLPTAPMNLQATVVSGTEIDLSWTASSYATGYTIWMLPGGSATWVLIDNAVPATQTTYAVTGLMPGGTYYAFTVAPTNSSADSAVAYYDPPTQNAPPTATITSGTGFAPVTGTTTTLSAIATDDGPAGQLTYYWTVGNTGGDVVFSNNNSNAAANTTVTFYKAGTYAFFVRVTDGNGQIGRSQFAVTVNQTLTGIVIIPGDAAVVAGQARQFSAKAVDQFGDDMQDQPSFAWSLGAGGAGSVDTSGLYTAPSTVGGATFTVIASAGGKSGTANLALKNQSGAYVQATDVSKVKVFDDSGALKLTLPFTGPFPAKLTFRNAANITLPDGSYLDASQPLLVRKNAAGTVIQNYITGHAPPWTGMVLDPDGISFWACDYSCYVYKFNIASGAVLLGFYGSGSLGQMGILKAPLLELTVADHALPTTNKVTAITDQAIKDLYITEDRSTQSGDIDLSALFDANTNKVGKKIHLTIKRADGFVVEDTDFGNGATKGDVALPISATARDFVITTWSDDNDNGACDNGEDKRVVDVSVVKPWTAQGTWAAGVASFVKATADGASLRQLALDITGDADDAGLYLDMGPIKKGELIDVTPLLVALEQRVRNNIADAALSPNIKDSARFGWTPRRGFGVVQIGEAGLNSLFNGGWSGAKIRYNCSDMADIFWARGVQTTLNPGEFDKLIGNAHNVWNVYKKDISGTPLGNLQPGDWANFMNAPNCPIRGWQNENVIVVGADSYVGWGIGQDTYAGFKQDLYKIYNNAVKSTGTGWQLWFVSSVPGYEGQATFLDIAKLGQTIFGLRTGQ